MPLMKSSFSFLLLRPPAPPLALSMFPYSSIWTWSTECFIRSTTSNASSGMTNWRRHAFALACDNLISASNCRVVIGTESLWALALLWWKWRNSDFYIRFGLDCKTKVVQMLTLNSKNNPVKFQQRLLLPLGSNIAENMKYNLLLYLQGEGAFEMN